MRPVTGEKIPKNKDFLKCSLLQPVGSVDRSTRCPPGRSAKRRPSVRIRKGPRGLRPVTVAGRAATAGLSTAGVEGGQAGATRGLHAARRPEAVIAAQSSHPTCSLRSCGGGRDALPGCGSRAQSRLILVRTLSPAQTRAVTVRLTFAPAGFRRVPSPLASSPACFMMLRALLWSVLN